MGGESPVRELFRFGPSLPPPICYFAVSRARPPDSSSSVRLLARTRGGLAEDDETAQTHKANGGLRCSHGSCTYARAGGGEEDSDSSLSTRGDEALFGRFHRRSAGGRDGLTPPPEI